ncbi:c-type cytochrome biogenesis protein CcmI [Rhizobacter sp. LjRoot28]|uniref:c-type cytochrome biogenesis protein CcmI n=1 Tax=Rhizobacter sp. LjRoot28 TaxID=3342309 RepID=UPI003ECD2A8E
MSTFLAVAAVLTLVVLLRLLWPLWKGGRRGGALSIRQLNSKVYRDQLQELERDLARGQLTAAGYQESRDELQRRLLQDVEAAPEAVAASAGNPRAGRWTAIALMLLVPLGAAGLYSRVGNTGAIDAPVQGATPEHILKAVERLAATLEKSPENLEGWVLLARAYRSMERFTDSAAAFERAAPLVAQHADLLIENADVLAAASGDQLEGKPMDMVRRALALEPENPMGLMLMGTSAYRRGDMQGAVLQWERLLAVLPPESDESRQVQANIDQARRQGGEAMSATAPAATAPGAATPSNASASASASTASGESSASKASGGATVSGEVVLAPALAAQLKPDDVLFIVARPDDGSRVPLAVLRKRAGDLPLKFTLDDSLAMVPDRTVSKARAVVLVARISRSGQPIPQAGDLTSAATEPVAPGTSTVRLVIDRQM